MYEGELDASGKVLTLDADGPSFTIPSKTANYKDTIEIVSPDHRTLSSRFLGDDGQWHHFMTAHYRRKAYAGELRVSGSWWGDDRVASRTAGAGAADET